MFEYKNIIIRPSVNIYKLNEKDEEYEVTIWLNGGIAIDYAVLKTEEILKLHNDEERLNYLKSNKFKNEPESIFEEAKKELEDFSVKERNDWRLNVSISILSDKIKNNLKTILNLAIINSFEHIFK